MNEEQLEIGAVKLIAQWCLDNSRQRLSARQKHVLKQHLRNWLGRWRGGVRSVEDIPPHKIAAVMPAYVQEVINHPIRNG